MRLPFALEGLSGPVEDKSAGVGSVRPTRSVEYGSCDRPRRRSIEVA